MFEHLQHNYDAHIADAAKRYKRAYCNLDLERSEEARVEFMKDQEHLFWLLDAKQEGWNPDDFKSEWDE